MQQPTVKQLVDAGICPTCYNKQHNNCLYGDISKQIIFENDLLECFLVGNPRADGHVAISSKQHFKDMTEIPTELCVQTFVFAQKCMQALKQVYNCPSVYLCTMCDGPMNHFHVQLIPRHGNEERGSKNFVKPRKQYQHNQQIVDQLKNLLK
ncbi:MAG: HIT family protein [Clostridia bacterium]|nr:HIT family protein [Clostridia bacterium]MBR2966162.1 HIT family protein [Clostridia bacterium]